MATLQGVIRFLGLVTLGGLVGGISALAAVNFVAAVFWLNDLLLMSPRARMMFEHPQWLVATTLAVPVAGGLLVGQLHRLLPEPRSHGPADVIAAVQTRRGRLPARAGVVSALSALLSLGSGASVGQYGPLVHLGASLGSGGARWLRLGRSEDSITIACGVAAAIATAFNAPLAGIVFAHEVVLRHYALRAFAPVAAASLIGHVIAINVLDQGALFHVADTALPRSWEFAVFLVIGGLGALLAGAYMRAILAVGVQSARLPLPDSLRPALAGAMLGVAALWVPDILGMGRETLRFATIAGAFSSPELLIVMSLKLAATALCLGMGFGGGVFSPALVIGTLFGALAGTLVASLTGTTDTFVFYAICGMVAVTAPVIGAPLTTLLIVFELTGSYALMTAALASVTLACPIAAQLFGRSLFDIQLARRGLDLSVGRSQAMLSDTRLADLISNDCVTLVPDTRVAQAVSALTQAGHGEAHLVDVEGRYCCSVTLVDLEAMRERGDSPDVIGNCPRAPRPVLGPDASLWTAVRYMQHVSGEAIAVVDDDNRFLGVVFETRIAQVYLRHSDELNREEHGAG
ncbi:chloride channel protein [Halomonas sp. GXIMD04776]|uniref:chloride channel protein n=1 Tax=Halomonas sp. GXIMD04776 TaxID=3415605 RepID=UPI003CB3FEF3